MSTLTPSEMKVAGVLIIKVEEIDSLTLSVQVIDDGITPERCPGEGGWFTM